MRSICFFLVLFVSVKSVGGQDLTGRWEGTMDNEFLQLNIEQQDNQVCGYSWDSVMYANYDFCQAGFEGTYDPAQQVAILNGVQFLENSGNHILMRIRLWKQQGDRKDMIHATVSGKGLLASFLGPMADQVILRRVSIQPSRSAKMQRCFTAVYKKKKDNTQQKKPVALSTPPANMPDTAKTNKQTVAPEPVRRPSINKSPFLELAARKQSEQGRIIVTTDKINLKLYDNGVVDNDTVSVFYNGRLLVDHRRLSETPIELEVQLDPATSRHEITLFAENLGGIPPNTALIVVTAGTKRYELHSKASLEENAVLVFEYKKE